MARRLLLNPPACAGFASLIGENAVVHCTGFLVNNEMLGNSTQMEKMFHVYAHEDESESSLKNTLIEKALEVFSAYSVTRESIVTVGW